MIAISEIRLYDLFKEKFKLNEAEAREVVAELISSNEKTDKVLNERIEEKLQNSKDIFLTKSDKIELIDRIADVKLEIGNVKTTLIAWMFVFWVGQVAVIIGILSYILKK